MNNRFQGRSVGTNPTAVPAALVEASQRRLFIAGDQRSASGKWLRRFAKASPLSFRQ
jgi:hypothetical protein